MSHRNTPYSSKTNKAKDISFRWVFFALAGIGVAIYWIYMTQLEEPSLTFEEFRLFIGRMFHPNVLRHLIPLVAGFWLARSAALTLTELLYDLPDRHKARIYLTGRHSRVNKGTPVLVTRKNLDDMRKESATINVGGPGLVQIGHGEVAITERDGYVVKIYEAGIHYLEMLERIHSILDLRPQTKTIDGMVAFTREYMPITADITLRFKIDTGNVDADNGTPYPVDKEAVRKIVYGRNVTEDGLAAWDGKTGFAVRFNFLKVIRKYSMSEILYSENVYANIHNELTPLVEAWLNNIGFNLIGVRVANIKPQNDEVFKVYTNFWHAAQQIELEGIEEVEQASYKLKQLTNKSKAELKMIEEIIQGIDDARHGGAVIDVKTAVSLRLIQAMEGLVSYTEENEPEPVAVPELTTGRATLALIQSQLREATTRQE